MAKPGPKPSESSDYTEVVAVKLSPQLKDGLKRLVNERKAEDHSLPLRWGLSDFMRELLENELRRKGR